MNRIDNIKGKFNIMTHVVAGYPDVNTCRELILMMAESGVDLIEIQIPFSDPLADGPTIMEASQQALDNGITVKDCFDLVASVRGKITIPLLFMSYANIPFRYGLKRFINDCSNVGIDGLIIPDIPFDERLEYIKTADEVGVYAIQVVSPDIEENRLREIIKISKGFMYTTLKVGITGAGKEISTQGKSFVQQLKQKTTLPVLAGFGISSNEHINQLKNISDGAVIGSHVLNLFNTEGINSVREFLISIKS
jgi:tryptophan synthase alpha chain